MAKDVSILKADPEGIGPAGHLISIFDPSDVGQALNDNGWTNSEVFELLVGIARDAANNTARERMAAMKFIEDKSEKALTLAGIIRRVSLEAQRNEGGTQKKLTADGLQLIKEGAARTLSTLELLEAGSQTPELIEVDPEEETDDTRTRSDVPAPRYVPSRPADPTGQPDVSTGASSRRSEPGLSPSSSVHGPERTNTAHPQGRGQDDDTNPIGGTEDERSSRTPIQPGGSSPSSSPRTENPECGRETGPDHWGHSSPEDGGIGCVSRSVRRTTPYTPGEARRRASVVPGPAGPAEAPPTLDGGRPPDGDPDTRGPRIAARHLPAELAAAGFPGDSTT